uniref:G-protein coupled receptors family 1 profile domain-containing protein n=1 Tax=Pelusios castaneus TaxID=367368 RepID=A0A8C8VKZ0_9SAUR
MELSTLPGAEAYSDFFNGSRQDFAASSFPNQSFNDSGRYAAKNATSIIIAIAITALYSVVCVVGLLGNILVMYGIIR